MKPSIAGSESFILFISFKKLAFCESDLNGSVLFLFSLTSMCCANGYVSSVSDLPYLFDSLGLLETQVCWRSGVHLKSTVSLSWR